MSRIAASRSTFTYGMIFLALSSGLIAGRMLHRRRYESRHGIGQQLARIRERCPDLHIVEFLPGEPRMGVYITVQPREREELTSLYRGTERMACWRGVVFAQGNAATLSDTLLADWQGIHFVAENTIFFGDSELLRRLQTVLND